MKITFVKDTKESAIKDLKRRATCNLISCSLYNEALNLINSGKSISYYVSSVSGIVTGIKIND